RGDCQLKVRKQRSVIDLAGAKALFGPLSPVASQHEHLVSIRVDDPILGHAENEIFFSLLDVVSVMRAGRDNFNNEVWDPTRPESCAGLRRQALRSAQFST